MNWRGAYGGTTDIYVNEVIAETDLAILCDIDDEEIWLPISQIKGFDDDIHGVGFSGDLTITAWIAKEKGLL